MTSVGLCGTIAALSHIVKLDYATMTLWEGKRQEFVQITLLYIISLKTKRCFALFLEAVFLDIPHSLCLQSINAASCHLCPLILAAAGVTTQLNLTEHEGRGPLVPCPPCLGSCFADSDAEAPGPPDYLPLSLFFLGTDPPRPCVSWPRTIAVLFPCGWSPYFSFAYPFDKSAGLAVSSVCLDSLT